MVWVQTVVALLLFLSTSCGSAVALERATMEGDVVLLEDQWCKAASFEIVDKGYSDNFRGWYDPLDCGICNQYCRWVGNSGSGGDPSISTVHRSSFWSCQTGDEEPSQIWTKYDGNSFPFPKCNSRNVWFEKSRQRPFVFFPGVLVGQSIFIEEEELPPGRDKVSNLEVRITLDGADVDGTTFLDTPPSMYLAKAGESNRTNFDEFTLCENGSNSTSSAPRCQPGTRTLYSDNISDNDDAVAPRDSLIRFDGVPVAGEWILWVLGGGASFQVTGKLLDFTVSFADDI